MINAAKLAFHISLSATLLFTSCNGQTPETKETGNKRSKITKTQGSDRYQDIWCGLEDKKGNLWFATSGEGVYRYDGASFTQFTIDNGLSNNVVCSMLEDREGNIWIGTKNGLCCFNGKEMSQVHIGVNASFPSLSPGSKDASQTAEISVFSVMQDRKGLLWFGTTDGVRCYDGKLFTTFLDAHSIINDSSLTLKSVQCMCEDRKGHIWFGSGPMAFEGLCMYDGRKLIKAGPQNENWIRSIKEDVNGDLLLATRHIGPMVFDGKGYRNIPSPPALRNDLLTYLFKDHNGNIWFASDYVNDNDVNTGGLWRSDGKTFTEFTKETGLSNTSVTLVFEDKNNNIWIGTRDVGLYRYDGKAFTSFSE